MSRPVDRLSYLHASNYEFVSDLANTFDPCKNLNDVFQSIPIEDVDVENLKVYLRVRPSLPEENQENEDTHVDILDNHNIILTAPASSNTFKNSTSGITKLSQKFTFSQIYGPSTNQKDLFGGSTLGLVKDFVNGQNCLLFTYGATNSGKTYTVQGTPTNAGILPRALEVIFNTVSEHQYVHNDLKPRYFCGISRLEESDIKKEEEKKERIFKITSDLGSTFSQSTMSLSKISLGDDTLNTTDPSSVSDLSRVSSVIETRHEDASVEVENSETTVYALFVSFAEIYNEYIYDLLEKMPTCKKNKRNALTLGEDRNGSIYIKGLQEVRVRSAEEAWRLLEIGRQNLHFAATRLNHNSSRSHCIFTIKLVRLADSENPHVARVSMMSVCDLAGAERAGKTQSTHDRLKEAGNINSSLLVLSRCIEALRRNQMQKGNKKREVPVPYRDSKLTRLFQSFFLGRGKAAMIVNISKTPLLFDETLQVLKFSAIAKQVAISQAKEPECQVKIPKRNSHISKFLRQSLNSSGRLSVPWAKDADVTFGESEKEEVMETVQEEEEDDDDERYEALIQLISSLKDELMKEHKEKVQMEKRIRGELCAEFSQQLVEIESTWNQRLKDQQARSEELADWRINALMKSTKKTNSRKRIRPEDDPDEEYVSSILLHQEERKVQEKETYIAELETEKKHMEDEVDALKSSQKKTSELLTKSQEENSKITFQLAQLTANFDKVNKQLETLQRTSMSITTESLVIEELKRQLEDNKTSVADKDEEIKELKEMLTECAEEFIAKQHECSTLAQSLEASEGNMAKQLVTLSELESQLIEAREIISQYAAQVEERDQHTAELREELEASKNVDQQIEDMAALQKLAETQQRKVNSLEKKLSDKESDCKVLQKRVNEAVCQKQKIEEDYLRDKSKLLLELADLKRNGSQKVIGSKELAEDLQLQMKVTDLENQKEELSKERDQLKNQLTESKDLFAHLQTANSQLESQFSATTKENDTLKNTVEELSSKLVNIQEERAEEQLDMSSQKATAAAEAVSQASDYQKHIEEKDEQIIELKTQVTDLQTEMKVLEENKNKECDKLEKIQSHSEALASERDDMEVKIKELIEELASQKEEMECLKQSSCPEEKFVQVKEELDKKSEEIDRLITEKENLQSTLSEYKDKIDEANLLVENIEKEKQTIIENLQVDISAKDDQIDELKRELTILKKEIEIARGDILQLQELQTQLKHEQLQNKEALSVKQDLEEKVQFKNAKIEEQNCEIERLANEIQTKDERNDVNLEQLKRDFDDIKDEKEKLQEQMKSHQEETEKTLQQINLEKEELSEEINNLKGAVMQLEEGKSSLELQLDELPKLQERENELKAHIAKLEHEKTLVEKKLLEQEDSSIFEEKMGEQEQEISVLRKEKAELHEKYSSIKEQHNELSKHVNEKTEVIAALNAKVESLDYKLNLAEEELESKKQEVTHELYDAREKCDILEKEVRAVREARQEEVAQLRGEKDLHDEQLQQKEEEIKSLQQEVKKLLQQSISSVSNTSQITVPETPKVKRESDQVDQDVLALKEQFRVSEAQKDALLQEVSGLKNQLEKLSLISDSSGILCPANMESSKQSVECNNSQSDIESISTPCGKGKRKGNKPAPIPSDSLHLFLDTTEADGSSFLSPLSVPVSSNKKTVEKPKRSSRRTQSRKVYENSFENQDESPWKPQKTFAEDEDDDTAWEPALSTNKPARVTRNTRGRKAKSQIYNPHTDQENKSSLANKAEVPADAKTPTQRRRRQLYNSTTEEPYQCSPNTIELPPVQDSPHSVVRRQLRSKRKK